MGVYFSGSPSRGGRGAGKLSIRLRKVKNLVNNASILTTFSLKSCEFLENFPSNHAIVFHFLENFRILSQISREILKFWKQCVNFVLGKIRIFEKIYTHDRRRNFQNSTFSVF